MQSHHGLCPLHIAQSCSEAGEQGLTPAGGVFAFHFRAAGKRGPAPRP